MESWNGAFNGWTASLVRENGVEYCANNGANSVMACHAAVGPPPQLHGPPGPSAANYVAVEGPPDQVWLPWMVRFATSGPPLASWLKGIKPWLEYLWLFSKSAIHVYCNGEWWMSDLATTRAVSSTRLPYFSIATICIRFCAAITIDGEWNLNTQWFLSLHMHAGALELAS